MDWAGNPWIVAQSMDPCFEQRNPWIVQIHALSPTYIRSLNETLKLLLTTKPNSQALLHLCYISCNIIILLDPHIHCTCRHSIKLAMLVNNRVSLSNRALYYPMYSYMLRAPHKYLHAITISYTRFLYFSVISNFPGLLYSTTWLESVIFCSYLASLILIMST